MKKHISIMLCLITVFALVSCGKKESAKAPAAETAVMNAVITEIQNQTMLVTPVEGSPELKSSDFFMIPMENLPASPEPQVGDTLSITYDGYILETYPASLSGITEITVIKQAQDTTAENEVGGDLIPMVRVNGKLYLDTGRKSKVSHRCGTMDGTITSSVPQTEVPTQDDQSNFGTDYGYQYGQENTIEISINDEWWVFALEQSKIQWQALPVDCADIAVFLSQQESETVRGFVEGCKYEIGTADCLNDYQFIREDGSTLYYHSDCGTFNDTVLERSYHLSEEMKAAVNAILSQYWSEISLECMVSNPAMCSGVPLKPSDEKN